MSAIFGEKLTFPQENGSEVELLVFGDEFYARRETLEGYTVLYDEALGQYCYAVLQDGRFASSGIPISEPLPTGIQPHLEEDTHVRQEKFSQRYVELRPSEADLPFNP